MLNSKQAKLGYAAAAVIAGGALLVLMLATGGAADSQSTAATQPTAASKEPPSPTKPKTKAGPARHPSGPLELYKRGHSIVWVRLGEKVQLRDAPGGNVIRTVGPHTEWGSRRVFSIAGERDGWAGFPTPLVGNGRLAWVKLDSSRLKAGFVRDEIIVDLSDYRAELLRGGRAVRSFPIAIGAPTSPTPTGRFAVTDTFRGDLNSAYGCCAVALTAVQPYISSGWLGGNRIAIHGAPGGSAGVAVSHGCVHAADADVSALVNNAPPGTPVLIRQ